MKDKERTALINSIEERIKAKNFELEEVNYLLQIIYPIAKKYASDYPIYNEANFQEIFQALELIEKRFDIDPKKYSP